MHTSNYGLYTKLTSRVPFVLDVCSLINAGWKYVMVMAQAPERKKRNERKHIQHAWDREEKKGSSKMTRKKIRWNKREKEQKKNEKKPMMLRINMQTIFY